MTLDDLRRQYLSAGLIESDVDPDPIKQFSAWLRTALDNEPADWYETNAMTLATATKDGRVSARMVLLKDVSQRGFVFYTNYDSRKGQELAENPRAALVVYWGHLLRQVRIEGTVERIDRITSERYFKTRPHGSQMGAAISPQSQVISSRADLETKLDSYQAEIGSKREVPLPENWGGYCLRPQRIEFWQGRKDRLHDRICYLCDENDGWKIVRLAP